MNNNVKIALIVVFVSVIIILEVLIQNFTDSTLSKMEKEIEDLKNSLLAENHEESKKKSEEIKAYWEEKEEKFGYFMDHEEIEKLSTKIMIIDENANNSEYKLALEDSIEAKFLVKHIKDKLKMNMGNVF